MTINDSSSKIYLASYVKLSIIPLRSSGRQILVIWWPRTQRIAVANKLGVSLDVTGATFNRAELLGLILRGSESDALCCFGSPWLFT